MKFIGFKRTMALAAFGAALAAGAGVVSAPAAHADYERGCERIDWGFLASGYRTICDGPKRADGSWDRERREWTPEHYYTPYCSYYAWVCPPTRLIGESTQRWETYPVTDDTVLQGEPPWLPPGTFRIL